MVMILDAVDIKGQCRIRYPLVDSGGSLGLFRLSDVCRLIVAIFTWCILNLCSRTVH